MSKKILIISLLIFFGLLFLNGLDNTIGLSPATAEQLNTLDGLDLTANKITPFQSQTGTDKKYGAAFFATKIGGIIGVALSFIGILFLALMIYAGVSWMLAGGNEQTITKSKDLLVNAVIGLIIVFAAYAITVFVSQQFIGG